MRAASKLLPMPLLANTFVRYSCRIQFRILYHKTHEKSTFLLRFGSCDIDMFAGRMVLPVPGICPREGGTESRHHSSGLLLFLLDVGNLNFQLDIPPIRSVESKVDRGLLNHFPPCRSGCSHHPGRFLRCPSSRNAHRDQAGSHSQDKYGNRASGITSLPIAHEASEKIPERPQLFLACTIQHLINKLSNLLLAIHSSSSLL